MKSAYRIKKLCLLPNIAGKEETSTVKWNKRCQVVWIFAIFSTTILCSRLKISLSFGFVTFIPLLNFLWFLMLCLQGINYITLPLFYSVFGKSTSSPLWLSSPLKDTQGDKSRGHVAGTNSVVCTMWNLVAGTKYCPCNMLHGFKMIWIHATCRSDKSISLQLVAWCVLNRASLEISAGHWSLTGKIIEFDQ